MVDNNEEETRRPKDFNQHITDLLQSHPDLSEMSCTIINELSIQYTIFPNKTIQNGWLRDLKLPIAKLIIKNCVIVDLDIDAFDGHPFQLLLELELHDLLELTYLRRGIFNNLYRLKSLHIGYSEFYHYLNFEEQVLYGVMTVANIYLHNCISNPLVLLNITGQNAVPLPDLQVLDLQNNRLTTVEEYSFIRAKNLFLLNLSNNNLLSINERAFWNVNIRQLFINNNFLSYIPPEIFKDITKTVGDVEIYASNNEWHCVCSLEWFQTFYLLSGLVEKPLYCSFGDGSHMFDDFDFGCETTTSIITPTTTTTTEVTSTNDNNFPDTSTPWYKKMYCKDAIFFPILTILTSTKEANGNTTISFLVDDRMSIIDTYDILGNPPIVEVNLLGNLQKHYLVWFRTSNISDYGCLTNVQNKVYIYDLMSDCTYTVCLVVDESNESSPFQCIGFTILPDWKERAWLKNNAKALVFVIISLILLFTILITTVIVFIVVRRHPTLLRGNKRIIIVESKTADAIVMPRNYEGDIYKAPSFISYGHGYLKTVNRAGDYSEMDYCKPTVWTVDDGGFSTTNDIYSSEEDFTSSSPDIRNSMTYGDLPPPLPPPNQNRIVNLTYEEINIPQNYSTA